jgi:hypothetical protein
VGAGQGRGTREPPRLVAAWDGGGELAALEPSLTATGKRDFRALTALLEQPVRAGHRPPSKPVWHASMRLAPEDRYRTISDATWGNMAVQMLTEAGVATASGDPGLRWTWVALVDAVMSPLLRDCLPRGVGRRLAICRPRACVADPDRQNLDLG